MLVLRLLGILALLAAGCSVVVFFLTGDRRYLRFAWQVLKYTLLFALFIAALLLAERFLVFI